MPQQLLRLIDKHGSDMSKNRKTKRTKPIKNQKRSQSIRKVPRAARSAEARRWADWQETDGKRNKVTVYKTDAAGNIIAKEIEQ